MPVHVSSTVCSSSGGQNCTIQHLVSSHSVGGRLVHSPLSTCFAGFNKTADVVIQQHSRKLLMMDILMSETC